ncbi:protein PHOTOPERIOD-INDEPENDENT EARLY FLOWERING 1 isoform X1 [Nicotiana sylvestris]|nr:PREDICTED: protein PHOTOPERIOD-INDEPENDENT EARLY FLOWERING 1 [Nicotiana sylvestris]XP_009759628.1 PREDICTED: protein PHOTOPERIOD-INDEPENDENT EARLY FLOWERING 1 [Nicotiana sylvestris]
MASKGYKSKPDHEIRVRRQKGLEAPKEPRRPKTHWDHVLEEMVWLSKDFESERKWKLAQAKKVAIRASKGMLDQATRGEKRVKEEEQRLRKVALNISKDIKKFWLKIEKLVLYKHQLELDEKKKKALDKQLEFLLGQTERYSTMLAENLVSSPTTSKRTNSLSAPEALRIQLKEGSEGDVKNRAGENLQSHSTGSDIDDDFDVQSEDEMEDDEHTIEEDEAVITKEEREEELAALQNEMDLPLEELLKHYAVGEASRDCSPEKSGADVTVSSGEDSDKCRDDDVAIETNGGCSPAISGRRSVESNGVLSVPNNQYPDLGQNKLKIPPKKYQELDKVNLLGVFNDEQDDDDYVLALGENKECNMDDETTLLEEEELAKAEPNDAADEIALLQKESELPLDELLARYKEDYDSDENVGDDSESYASASTAQNVSELSQVNDGLSDVLPTTVAETEEREVESMDKTGEERQSENFSESPAKNESEPNQVNDGPNDLLPTTVTETEEKEVRSMDKTVEERQGEDFSESPAKNESEPSQVNDGPSDVLPATVTETEEKEVGSMDKTGEERQSDDIIADAAAAARSAQPTGNTFSTTKVRTKFPFLLKFPLREYQHIGLDWLVTMYEKKLNGILADEMGLGKTIMTIALLAHLACEKGIWGPHLIVVPTSVMLNWETEFLRWCPAFKILTYFGSAKERKIKRQGWLKPNSFHICITTYRLVIQDSKVFKRKKWKYLILDEAHLIKNWKSQRWQTLLNFNSKRRILLTGTPLQNDLMELWSLMHFLMPHIFQSHQEFKDWFCNPISGMVEGQEKVNKEVVDRLHNVLRPFILRRLKRDVEKQLPSKHEHVIYCKLSRRQRNLYEDFIASSETQATLASSNFFAMISVIMQLRKVCNHPDLFEGRPIVSSFDMSGIDMHLSSSICSILSHGIFSSINLGALGLLFTHLDFSMTSWESHDVQSIATPSSLIEGRVTQIHGEETSLVLKRNKKFHGTNIFEEIQKALVEERLREAKERAASVAWWNSIKCKRKPVYSTSLREIVTVKHPVHGIYCQKSNPLSYLYSSRLADLILSPVERFQKMVDQVETFMFAIPAARSPAPACWCSKPGTSVFFSPTFKERSSKVLSPLLTPFRPAIVRRQVYFPDRRLIQFDCGKLQELAGLLRRLKSGGHRALIFTQMTKMLDVLEAFINLYGYTYMRLDGSTLPEQRQTLMQRFNTNPKIFLFILSTRSGGVGINLVGADTVIFYDSDWNPAMDQQAQDRCHRIGQTREVHIYRLISESTIEENILKKANQKRALDDLVIQGGSYNTEFFKKLDPMELFSGHRTVSLKNIEGEKNSNVTEVQLSNADVEAALQNVEDEADYMALKKVEQEEAVDNQEFTEEAVGRLEEDELGNDDEMKADEPADHEVPVTTSGKELVAMSNASNPLKEQAITFAGKDDDIDMLADVKQMAAAAAAAGQAILSFESQLRPIDRYAVRFLELWDPIIDKTAIESQGHFEETEWELDRIEKLKEDMEAEIDDDEEPLVYERWDADFATEVYRQQVEALAQHQLMEELEAEAKEKELAEYENSMGHATASVPKSKSKKKAKKTKFKSLKKGGLASEPQALKDGSSIELLPIDDDVLSSEPVTTPDSAQERKRRLATGDEDVKSSKKSKKLKKSSEVSSLVMHSTYHGKRQVESKGLKQYDGGTMDAELRPISRSKMGGKISISPMPVKRVLTIKSEKPIRKGKTWYKDYFPSADSWLPQEDAVLCASVHEYGPHWSLVSDILYGMTAGGVYRGRYRHPILCCERFRELIQRYVLSTTDGVNDRSTNAGSIKGLLKVTEENVRLVLDIASEVPDHEPLVQKHFFALLSSVWKMSCRKSQTNAFSSSQNGFYHSGSLFTLFTPTMNLGSTNYATGPLEKRFSNLSICAKLVAAALSDQQSAQSDERVSICDQREEASFPAEQLDVTLEFGAEKDNKIIPLPSPVTVKIRGPETPLHPGMMIAEHQHFKSSLNVAENRFWAASSTESCLDWASLAFPVGDAKSRTPLTSQFLGKHKLSDSVKVSKSKSRKIPTESSDVGRTKDLVILPMPSASNDSCARADVGLSFLAESGHDFEDRTLFNLNSEFNLGSEDVFQHEYVPDFISGLDDWSVFPDFTDIG